MKEICIPFSNIADEEKAEVEVRVPGTGKVWKYRVEPVHVTYPGKDETKQTRGIDRLMQFIGAYNQNWELIQIIDMNEKTGNMHMLYREKQFPASLL
jgi:hypothetical protein